MRNARNSRVVTATAEKNRVAGLGYAMDRPASATGFTGRSALGDLTNVTANIKAAVHPTKAAKLNERAPCVAPTGSVSIPVKMSIVSIAAPVEAMSGVQLDVAPEPQVQSTDPQAVAIYAPQIYDKMFEDEVQALLPRSNYMDLQHDLNGKMRAILVDWLVEVHMKYRLRPETLFLTVNLVDRYLSSAVVMRKRLQLIGVTAMFIASKFEEIDPPPIHNFVYITDNAYTREEILHMECGILVSLGFQVIAPTPGHFMERLLRAHGCDDRHKSLARYILELALLDIRQLKYNPSLLASAALLLSNEILGQPHVWPPVLANIARYEQSILRSCANELKALLDAAPTGALQAVRKKYMQPSYYNVASSRLAGRTASAAGYGGA